MTGTCYLRLESVNYLSNFVYDTQDLSTIRGGGLLLLDAVKRIETKFSRDLNPVSTGASSGLFKFKNTVTVENAESVRKNIEDCLNNDDELKHATFVVDTHFMSEKCEFRQTVECLIAKNRWRQMQSPSVAVPGDAGSDVCPVDLVRPIGANKIFKNKELVSVSDSVDRRHNHGKNEKQNFYKTQTGLDKLPSFANDLDELTSDKGRGNLHHKMAVIYVDGNSFGKIQEECVDSQELNKWDTTIKEYRKCLLKDLLEKTINKPEWTTTTGATTGVHRMETLLWGGDELIWVVPAWTGWQTLNLFFEESKRWEFKNKTQTKKLTNAAGLVFCHHNAPIHRIKKLAQSLGELAKGDRNKSRFAYQVLESFDHTGSNLDKYRENFCPKETTPTDLILDGENMKAIQKNIKCLKEKEFPRNKLRKIVMGLLNDKTDEAKEDIKSVKKALEVEQTDALVKLRDICNGETMMWIHIAELWDYAL